MLIYLYIVKIKKKNVVARTLAPGSRGKAQFFLSLIARHVTRFRRAYIFCDHTRDVRAVQCIQRRRCRCIGPDRQSFDSSVTVVIYPNNAKDVRNMSEGHMKDGEVFTSARLRYYLDVYKRLECFSVQPSYDVRGKHIYENGGGGGEYDKRASNIFLRYCIALHLHAFGRPIVHRRIDMYRGSIRERETNSRGSTRDHTDV